MICQDQHFFPLPSLLLFLDRNLLSRENDLLLFLLREQGAFSFILFPRVRTTKLLRTTARRDLRHSNMSPLSLSLSLSFCLSLSLVERVESMNGSLLVSRPKETQRLQFPREILTISTRDGPPRWAEWHIASYRGQGAAFWVFEISR